MTKDRPGEAITIGGVEYKLFEDQIGPALRITYLYDPDKPVELLHFRSAAFALIAYDGATTRARAELEAELNRNQTETQNPKEIT